MMFLKHSPKKRFWVLALTLTFAAALAVAVGTIAWLRYTRSLQIVTNVSIASLNLVDANSQSLCINLGDIDMSKDGSKSCVFGVKSKDAEKYWIQLAHTTNLPLTYRIYRTPTPTDTTCNPANLLNGAYLNKADRRLLHSDTYGSYGVDKVQIDAEPLYWQYGPINIGKRQTDFFILELSWTGNANLKNNKETEMIYLTVGTIGRVNNSGTESNSGNSATGGTQ